MPSNRVGTRLLGSGKAVVDVSPVVRTSVGGLHAKRLGFIHPASREYVEFETGYPADLQHALDVIAAG